MLAGKVLNILCFCAGKFKVIDVVQMVLLLNLDIFHSFP